MKSSKVDQTKLKNAKLKKHKIRTLASDYLSSISLTGNCDTEAKQVYFDRIISNEFDCFLSFNKINNLPNNQNDYFNYYKQKLSKENPSSSRTNDFLKSEFYERKCSISYIEGILSNNSQQQDEKNEKLNQLNIPSIKILPSLTFENSTELNPAILCLKQKTSMSDAESDYIKTRIENSSKNASNNTNIQLATSNVTISSTSSVSTQISSSHKLAHSINSALQSTRHKLSHKTFKSPDEAILLSNPTNIISATKSNSSTIRKVQRTISESSNESFNPLNISARNSGSYSTTASNRTFMNYKPALFNNLKRLTNEKILLTSNSSPVGIFSRLPFRLENNESFITNKTRHMSMNKTFYTQNNFIKDVFDLLELDFDDYVNSGSMSYAYLIDPNSQLKRGHFQKRPSDDTQQTNKSTDQIIERIDENFDEFNEKDELNEIGKSMSYNNKKDSFKRERERSFSFPNNKRYTKELSPFNLSTYQADYLDDPQLTEMTAGKNRTCLKFASYAVSIIDYVKPLDLKKEINETFKEKFPYIQISLTKLRSIKRELLEIAHESSLDFIIVAQAYIYFEKLILQGLINKTNRKYLGANCLVIAAKLNDVTKKDINKLIDNIINKFRFDNRKEVILYEFPILVALEFNLIIKYESEFLSHYERLLNNLDCLKFNNSDQYKQNHQRTFSD